MEIPFDNTYVSLPDRFYAPVSPAPVRDPHVLLFNQPLADELNLGEMAGKEKAAADLFGGNRVPQGAQPVAQVYAGHQFGSFVPRLGDGRALLLGEVLDKFGHHRDISLKGSGPTVYSRRGDGRSALGPVLREYIVSEAMHALGVPTTRSLAAVATGEPVYREAPLPGGVLTRVAASHIRVGTFEYFAARGDIEALQLLADYAIERHYPEAAESTEPYIALLDGVMRRQAELTAHWMSLGFIHGVMNTDNTAVSGETIDYGPCAFMDEYDVYQTFSSIDTQGRYAYGRQAAITLWNLENLAGCLAPLIDPDRQTAEHQLRAVLQGFPDYFNLRFLERMGSKLGFSAEDIPAAEGLVADFLQRLQTAGADFTTIFYRLQYALVSGTVRELQLPADQEPVFNRWFERWRDAIRDPDAAAARMQQANPACIPRNHVVEQALKAAVEHQDMRLCHQLLAAVRHPWTRPPDAFYYPPAPEERVTVTFCGT
ncbi:protein adenylyltransferase SelO [Spirochaeta africana]|uniref:Protein nucleotidyltransferase YdiU n=1 Tax=Spirochaeta africana (strain ATCC 700263 / DSM 8902 / Z-7692) TaxID=889378 RepID=H9UHR5_SPIAZ|nr:YdiU family protein [Spirochaeta africana]AFG37058.1 hypothetical protein Spiaf_0969 [Spirochaeta africana DSM 8902]